ncbi:MAG: YebC/PmpR family DNA-binding transcriptional regulator [Defluviitaleaceae bacterium]|nr:YebC/PmpR family DNA-binding transcriptional regulator [Defluviitaleaceae bacterium]
MAGHSKFANIKYKKERSDSKRSKIFTKVGRELAVAVKQGGSSPETNSRLRDAIAKAKASNMPNDNIDRAIKKAAGELGSVNYESVTYEGYGPGGVAVIVKALTDNRNRTAANVRNAFTKGGGNLGQTGSVDYIFKQIGEIFIEKSPNVNEDELMMQALDAGAADFIASDEGWEITTEPNDFTKVVDALKDTYTIFSAEVIMQPLTMAPPLSAAEEIKGFNKMIDLLEDDDDVQDVYHNLDGE